VKGGAPGASIKLHGSRLPVQAASPLAGISIFLRYVHEGVATSGRR
jgi:hypothetical protein